MSGKFRFRIPTPSPATVMAFIAVLFAMGGLAMAAIPASNGTIKGCYKKNKGTLRVVSDKKKCKKSERTLTWNQRGATGQAGSQGTQGPAGDTGAAGTARAWAHVFGNGTVDASKGMEVAREGTGQYCVKTPFTPKALVVTPRWQGLGAANNRVAHAGLNGFGTCATDLPGTNAFIVIQDGAAGAVVDTEFFVMVDGL